MQYKLQRIYSDYVQVGHDIVTSLEYRLLRHHFYTLDTSGTTEFTIHCIIELLLIWILRLNPKIFLRNYSPNDGK